MLKIKVDYSFKVKRTGVHDCPGEFAVWVKRGWFEKWQEISTYADF